MVRIIIGSVFLLISAILYGTKYLSAAISGVNSTSWGKDDFVRMLSYTPTLLNFYIYISFILGISLLIWYVVDFYNKNNK
ncbi:hypothetical protein [Senegalia massiliensis]|uniref:Uncharacterized protein n=1 Tax=Senegalia massiliensis TaxID=1720316 RepID=A0A845QYI8_9CLOT|nr:hypothetical protein [Senegalia massiliensis]NBI06212.1 hypothetical protein [Senegalia massiliensis]